MGMPMLVLPLLLAVCLSSVEADTVTPAKNGCYCLDSDNVQDSHCDASKCRKHGLSRYGDVIDKPLQVVGQYFSGLLIISLFTCTLLAGNEGTWRFIYTSFCAGNTATPYVAACCGI